MQVALADALTLSGDVEQGLTIYRHTADTVPGFPGLEGRMASANAMMGARERASGRYDAAIGHMQKAVSLSPKKADYHLRLAQYLVEAGLKSEAEEVLHRTAERFAGQPEVTKRLEDIRLRLLQRESSGGETEDD